MRTLELINLFFSGILAGLEIAAHYGFHDPTLALDEKPQIVLGQGLVRRLRWLVPSFFIPTTITAIILAIVSKNIIDLSLRIIALATIAIWVYVRIVGTVKINSASVGWDPNNPPKDWRNQIGKAERYHIVGTWATIIAFVCLLLAIEVTT